MTADWSDIITGHKLPGDKDVHRILGWRETALAVEAEREKFDTNAFIIADHYGTTGLSLILFATRAGPRRLRIRRWCCCIDSDAHAQSVSVLGQL